MALTFSYIINTRWILFSEDSDFWITDINGLSANEISISEAQGVGQIGSTLSAQSIKPKDLTVSGVLFGNLIANRRALLSTILPGVAARFVITDNAESWYLEGVPLRTPLIEETAVQQAFQFVFHAPYPYWRSTEDGSAQIAGLIQLFRFPCSLADSWYISKYSESLFTVVENEGAIPTEFDVVFTAYTEVTDPEIYHVERGKYIKINKVMAAGETITVSTAYGRKGVTLRLADGTQINGFKYLDVGSDLNMQMDPGANTIRSDAANNREGMRIQIIMPKGVVPGI